MIYVFLHGKPCHNSPLENDVKWNRMRNWHFPRWSHASSNMFQAWQGRSYPIIAKAEFTSFKMFQDVSSVKSSLSLWTTSIHLLMIRLILRACSIPQVPWFHAFPSTWQQMQDILIFLEKSLGFPRFSPKNPMKIPGIPDFSPLRHQLCRRSSARSWPRRRTRRSGPRRGATRRRTRRSIPGATGSCDGTWRRLGGSRDVGFHQNS